MNYNGNAGPCCTGRKRFLSLPIDQLFLHFSYDIIVTHPQNGLINLTASFMLYEPTSLYVISDHNSIFIHRLHLHKEIQTPPYSNLLFSFKDLNKKTHRYQISPEEKCEASVDFAGLTEHDWPSH